MVSGTSKKWHRANISPGNKSLSLFLFFFVKSTVFYVCVCVCVCMFIGVMSSPFSVPPEATTCGAEHRLSRGAVAVVFYVFTHCPEQILVFQLFLRNTSAIVARFFFFFFFFVCWTPTQISVRFHHDY